MTRVIIAGDLHLRYGGTNEAAVARFEEMLLNNPPDVLILGGDIYELWRRGLFSSGWSTYGFTNTVETLEQRGVEVQYIVGNHDEYVLYHTTGPDVPFEPRKNIRRTIDGTEIFVTHGHKYEPAYNPLTNDLLAYPDDRFGQLMSDIWNARPSPAGVDPLEDVASALLGPAASLPDPHAIRNQPFRTGPVKYGIEQESGDAWGVFGHIHTPYIDRAEKIVNWGSMVEGQRGYVEMKNGDVSLKQV